MKDIILLDGKKEYNYKDLLKMYESEERILVNLYNWEKNKLIRVNKNGMYERIWKIYKYIQYT